VRVALVNPPWSFEGSIYFGCREPHLALELGYSKSLLEAAGHEVSLVDGQLEGLDVAAIGARVEASRPDVAVLTTAPSYLFWRCAPPELTVPARVARVLRPLTPTLVVVGPHASTTPRAALAKLGADVAVLGECEEVLVRLVDALAADGREGWAKVASIAYPLDGDVVVQGPRASVDLGALPALTWPVGQVRRHTHHHHRFDAVPTGPGAELEATRGCPYTCTFCAKEEFRDAFRKRPLDRVLEELDGLVAQGVEYLYFIDEIFMPQRPLLEAIAARDVRFGVQLRIDLWDEETLDLLGRAGCVSIEAGVESISVEGRARLDKRCKASTERLTELLVRAKRSIPFVQANLLDASTDDPEAVDAWRSNLRRHGVWANKPVPLFPYPGSPDYRSLFGPADDLAWERAHSHYLAVVRELSDVQAEHPLPIAELERGLP
jgi:anaerobic magnesium-protoporphyrin IX monomethyl ester cyclase